MDAGGTGDCLAQPTLVEMGWGIARGRDGGWTAVVEWGSETRHRTDHGPVLQGAGGGARRTQTPRTRTPAPRCRAAYAAATSFQFTR